MNFLCFNFHTCFPWHCKMHQPKLATRGQHLWAFWKEGQPPYLPYRSAAWFCWPIALDRSGQHCKEHFSCSVSSSAFLPPPNLPSALLVTGINWYPLSSCMRLQSSRAFCPVAAKSIFAKTGTELNQNCWVDLLCCLNAWLCWHIWVSVCSPNKECVAVPSVLPRWDMAMRQPRSWEWQTRDT